MRQEILPILVFQTDFTYLEGAVASMYGVVRSVDRNVEIITATHELPQYDIWSASYRLQQYVEFWPKGTVFVSVVDPGVGTTRKACVAYTKDGYYIVTPDNGALTHVKEKHGIAEVREIDETTNRLKSTTGTSVFHGRDLFGYCAAKLASGKITFEAVGKEYSVDEIVTMDIPKSEIADGPLNGVIEIDDPNFGNCWSNIPVENMFKAGFSYGDDVMITITKNGEKLYDAVTRFDKTFGNVGKGEAILYNNELMNVSLALSQDNFMKKYGVYFGPEYEIEIKKSK